MEPGEPDTHVAVIGEGPGLAAVDADRLLLLLWRGDFVAAPDAALWQVGEAAAEPCCCMPACVVVLALQPSCTGGTWLAAQSGGQSLCRPAVVPSAHSTLYTLLPPPLGWPGRSFYRLRLDKLFRNEWGRAVLEFLRSTEEARMARLLSDFRVSETYVIVSYNPSGLFNPAHQDKRTGSSTHARVSCAAASSSAAGAAAALLLLLPARLRKPSASDAGRVKRTQLMSGLAS